MDDDVPQKIQGTRPAVFQVRWPYAPGNQPMVRRASLALLIPTSSEMVGSLAMLATLYLAAYYAPDGPQVRNIFGTLDPRSLKRMGAIHPQGIEQKPRNWQNRKLR